MKYVQENLLEFQDAKFFNNLNEADEEVSPADKKKEQEELRKKGMKVVQKCVKNFNDFKKFAGDIWQEYRDFWSTQQDAKESATLVKKDTGEKEDLIADFYNMWKSDYIVGVVPGSMGDTLKVFNTSTDDEDEYVVFSCPDEQVIAAFQDFLSNVLKATMKDVIDRQKAAMEAKKKADEQRQREETTAKKQAKLDAFLGESAKKLNESFAKVRKFSRDWPDVYRDELEAVMDGEYGKVRADTLSMVETEEELYKWWEANFAD